MVLGTVGQTALRFFINSVVGFLVLFQSVKVLNPALSTSSETSALFDIAPSSKISTKKNELENVLVESYGMAGSDGLKIESLEAEIVVELLTQARAQVLNSSDTDIRSKRLLDTLIKIIIDETYLLPGQTDQFPGVVFARTRLLMVCFLLWILTISVVSFIRSGAQGSIYEPPPTWNVWRETFILWSLMTGMTFFVFRCSRLIPCSFMRCCWIFIDLIVVLLEQ